MLFKILYEDPFLDSEPFLDLARSPEFSLSYRTGINYFFNTELGLVLSFEIRAALLFLNFPEEFILSPS